MRHFFRATRRLTVPALLLLALPACAEDCPDFFRFADLGLVDSDGQVRRGGPIFRGESLEGTSLIDREATECRPVQDLTSDGHGNPIPVVTRLTYSVDRLDIDLSALHVSYAEDIRGLAREALRPHLARLDSMGEIRGTSSICATSSDQISCQVVSPYPGNIDLVVYCDMAVCRMPVLAASDHVAISATWAVDEAFLKETETAGPSISAKVQAIHAFFLPLTSGL